MKLTDAKTACLTWIYNHDYYLYEIVSGSLSANEKQNSVRFTLHELEDKEPDFEAVIRETNGCFIFRADCYGEENVDNPLKLFAAEDELVLFFEDDFGHGFFRLGP